MNLYRNPIEKRTETSYPTRMNYISENKDAVNRLLDRFLRYVAVCSESSSGNAENGIFPSTECQRTFAETIASEMREIGLSDVTVTDDSYVYAVLPSNSDDGPGSVCLISHLDTSEEVSGKDVRPSVTRNYSGGKIALGGGTVLDPAHDEFLAEAAENSETIITSDGTTLLGADDKAGIANIMTAVEFLLMNPAVRHGTVEILLSPDEETGHGMDRAPLELIKSEYAYTVDGGHIGELETECFNACSAEVEFTGKATHTGEARKNGMVNAVGIAAAFISSLPAGMRPETTDGRMGFIAPLCVHGSIGKAAVSLLLRAFSQDEIDREKFIVRRTAETAALTCGGQSEISFRQQYLNMRDKIEGRPEVTGRLEKAFAAAGVVPVRRPIRGGTDGSRLTELGLPTPNIFTGGHNFHSKSEWASLNQMSRCADILVNIATV